MPITNESIKPYILVGAIIFGLVVPLIIWFIDKTFPPLFFIILFSVGITCIIHSALGGTEGSQFKVAAITFGGGAAVLMGSIWLLNPILERQMESAATAQRQVGNEKNVSELKQQLQVAQDEKVKLTQALTSATAELDQHRETLLADALVQIKALRRGDAIADSLIQMALTREGPWQPTSEEMGVKISVAGYLTGRNAAVCKGLSFRGKRVDITSTLVENGQYYRAEQPISVDSWSLISEQVCGADRKFDVQVGCQLAEEIFTSDVIRCSGRQPAWQGEFRNILPAAAVVIFE